MKKFSFFNLVLLLFIVGLAHGQNYTFKVLANKGDNKFKSGSEWMSVKTGASLHSADEVTLAKDSYLGLVHSTGKTLELKTAGTYKVKDLEAKVGKSSSSVASKYADFVLSKMTAESQKNRLKSTGSAKRGDSEIKVYLPSTGYVYNNSALIRWDSLNKSVQYVVTLTNMFDDVLETYTTSDTKMELDLNGEKLSKQNVILVKVTTKDGALESPVFAVKRLKGDDLEKVETSLNDLKSQIDEKSALNQFILAGFYEENGLILDAVSSYENAIELAPDVETYKIAYLDFAVRNNLAN